MDKSIKTVQNAADEISNDMPFAEELRAILNRASAQAQDDQDLFEGMGMPHLRTFLKVSPLGLAILDLADAILAASDPMKCPYTHPHTRQWCGYKGCRES